MPALDRYTDYDRLAWFYNRYWGRAYHPSALPVLDELVFKRMPKGARILDLCCGTGHLTQALAARGYKMTGIDGSAEMLDYARQNVRDGEFYALDARSFQLPYKFDIVLSTFESLNHVMSLAELERVFENVRRVLADGGVFVFDMLMEEAYRTEWGKSSAIVEADNVCIIRGGYDSDTRTGKTQITMFHLEAPDVWQRSDVTVHQHCYELGQVWSALEKAGFDEISSFDARRSLGMAGELGVGRTFFCAKKETPV